MRRAKRARGAVSSDRVSALALAVATVCATVGDLRGIDLDVGSEGPVVRDGAGCTRRVAVGCDGHRGFGDRAAERISPVIEHDGSQFFDRAYRRHVPRIVARFGVVNAGEPIIGDHRIDNAARDE